MKVLILSSATGGGHNAAGAAIKEALLQNGCEVDFLDMFSLSSERTARLVGQAYIKLASRLPRAFGLLYKAGSVISSSKYKSPVYFANGLMARKLNRHLLEHDYDAVIMPHLFPAETLTYMKRHHMKVPMTIAVSTDYTCIPFWEETNCDYYVIPHEDLTAEYIERGIPGEKLLPLGIPVKAAFLNRTKQDDARKALNLPCGIPMYLIMSGSMGFGKIHLFAYELSRRLRNGEQIVIICGNNTKLRNTLQREFSHNPNVHVLGYTEQVAEYMAACDVIYTKPGGLTTTEALQMNIPIVHTAPIPGCETKNREFFTARGMSIGAQHIRSQIRQGMLLVENEAVRLGMQSAQRSHTPSDPAGAIFTFLNNTIEKRSAL